MPKQHKRKAALAGLKSGLDIKHADAIALLDHPDADERETLAGYLETYVDITTYREAVGYLEQERNDPRNQLLCSRCGWTNGMVCPECAKGCGCEYGCTGWRHHEYAGDDADDGFDPNACEECGAGGSGNPYEECTCYDDYDDDTEGVEAGVVTV